MHSKQKGNIGEAAAILELAKNGWNVFKEIGDLSKIDLIAEKDGRIIRVQCKGYEVKDEKIEVSFRKCGPNYVCHYKETDFDYMSVCRLDTNEVAWLPSSILQVNLNSMVLRIVRPKSAHGQKINMFEDFRSLPE